MIELLVLGGLVIAGLAVMAVLGFVFFLFRVVLWVVLLPFRLLFLPFRLMFLPFRLLWKLILVPVWLTLGGVGLAVGTVAIPLALAAVAVVAALGIVAAILAFILPVIPILLLALLVWATAIGVQSRLEARSELRQESAELNQLTVSVIQPKLADAQEELILPGNMQAYLDTPIHARTNAWRRPVMMNGEAPGTITFQNRAAVPAPMELPARSHRGFTARTPDQALRRAGNSAA